MRQVVGEAAAEESDFRPSSTADDGEIGGGEQASRVLSLGGEWGLRTGEGEDIRF